MTAFRLTTLCAGVLLCACPRTTTSLPQGDCAVGIRAALSHEADGGVETAEATEASDTGIHVRSGELANLMFYYTSEFDFQYQSNIANADNGLVERTLVPTQWVEVTPDDKSVYIYDVIPVDTTGLAGAYTVNVGAHLSVNPDKFHCTGPRDSTGHLTVSTWRTLTLQVDPSSSSTSGPRASSSARASSAAGASSSTSGTASSN